MVLAMNFFHHLSDEQSQRMLDTVRAAAQKSSIRLLAGEPTLPRFRENPIGYLLAKADEGDYVRSLEDTKKLFGSALRSTTVGPLNPIWPIPGAFFELEFAPSQGRMSEPGKTGSCASR